MRARVVLLFTFCGLLAAGVTPARAAAFTISLDTSALVGQGDFALDFQLIDGDGVANTTVVLRDFTFGAGGPAGSPTLVGGASGSLATGLTLEDTAGFTRAAGGFTPGATLSFLLEVTGSSDASTPDYFTMALLGPDGFEVPTLGSVEELLSLALEAGAVPEAFGTDLDCTAPDDTNPGCTDLDVPAPTVTAVPEPATALLVLTGAALIGVRRRR